MLQQSAYRRAPTMVVPLGPAAGRIKELSAAPVADVPVEIARVKVSPKCSSPLPYPENEEEELAAAYDGPLPFHLVSALTEVGLDDARLGSMFCEFIPSLSKFKSRSSKKKRKKQPRRPR